MKLAIIWIAKPYTVIIRFDHWNIRWNIRAFMTNENSMQMEFKVFGVRLSQVFNI